MTAVGLVILMVIGSAQAALAHGDEQRHVDGSMGMSSAAGNMKGGFLSTKNIDGYSVSFHIMKASEGVAHGASHHVMVKVVQNGKVVTDLMVNSRVVHPNGKSESKMMMRMGDWYMAAYDLSHPGSHQLMVLFKSSDGKKHFGGVSYPVQQQNNGG